MCLEFLVYKLILQSSGKKKKTIVLYQDIWKVLAIRDFPHLLRQGRRMIIKRVEYMSENMFRFFLEYCLCPLRDPATILDVFIGAEYSGCDPISLASANPTMSTSCGLLCRWRLCQTLWRKRIKALVAWGTLISKSCRQTSYGWINVPKA